MTLDSDSPLIIGLGFALILMFVLWLIQLINRDAGIVDVGWSGSIGLLAIYYLLALNNATWESVLVASLTAIWSFRLATHLLHDRVLGKPEDGRYQKLRQTFGTWSHQFFLAFFLAQAVLAWLFSIPAWIAMNRTGPFGAWDTAGIVLWVVSVGGEYLADAQLARFRADPANRGKTCRYGLWNYSRHPNYFFEWLHWWVYVLIGWQAPFGWVTLFAPLLMLFFLFKITGIPATEAHALTSRGDAYREYQQTTSVFIPWFNKSHRTQIRDTDM